MAGLTWFELDVDFHAHPKTIALRVALKNPLAECYVSRVWAYCYHHAIDRFEGPAAVATIEDAARWKGPAGKLVEALVTVGYMDRTEDGVLVAHGVGERLGPHLKAKKNAAVRQKRRRNRVSGERDEDASSPSDSDEHHGSVTRDEPGDVPRTYALYSDRDRDSNQKQAAAALSQPASGAHPVAPAAPNEPPRLEVVDSVSGRADGPPAFPLAVEFRHRLAERLARTAPHPVGGGRSVWESLERALAVVPPAEAVELCATRVFESVTAGRRQPGTLGYFAQVLADAVTERRATDADTAAFTPAVALEDLPAIEFEA